MFSCEIEKQNRFFIWSTRSLLLTTHQICNIKQNEIKRSIPLKNIDALTKNGSNKEEFLLHVKNEYDYRMKCSKREELFDNLKQVYFNIFNDNLHIFAVPKNITDYLTSKGDVKKGQNSNIPPEIYRQYDEDVYEPFDEDEFDIADEEIDEMKTEGLVSPVMCVSIIDC